MKRSQISVLLLLVPQSLCSDVNLLTYFTILGQTAERRKLISSIKKIIADRKQYESPHIESAAVFSSLDLPLSGEEHDRKYKSGIPSDSYTDSSLVGALKRYSVDISGDFGDEDQEPNKTTAFVKVSSPVDASKESTETIQSMISLSSLQTTSDAYSATQEKLDLTEANVDNVNSELIMIPEEMESKSPPLAGDNVMNVIMVAAECAPWSKTGILDHYNRYPFFGSLSVLLLHIFIFWFRAHFSSVAYTN